MKLCTFENCIRKHVAKGYCYGHYRQYKDGKELMPIRKVHSPVCTFEGCNKVHRSLGLCEGHYAQQRRGEELRELRPRYKAECAFESCLNKSRAYGYCSGHYSQKRYGKELKPLKTESVGWTDENGYRWISVDGNRIREHSYVMSQYIGRPLIEGENVHHKYGDRADNRIEKLELWSTSQPRGQRVKDKLEWAREIIEIYGDLEKEGLL